MVRGHGFGFAPHTRALAPRTTPRQTAQAITFYAEELMLTDPNIQVAIVWTLIAVLAGALLASYPAYCWGRRQGRRGIIYAKAASFEAGRESGEELGRIEGLREYHAERARKSQETRDRNREARATMLVGWDVPPSVSESDAEGARDHGEGEE